MKKVDIRSFAIKHWKLIVSYSSLFILLIGLLSYRLGSLVSGFSKSELQTYRASQSLRSIFIYPVNAPYKVIGRAIFQLHTRNVLLDFRIYSVFLGLVTLVIFCGLLHYWYGFKTAMVGTILFGTSSWFLHIARSGTPEILLFAYFALFSSNIWLRSSRSKYALLTSLLLSSILLYIPGMIWLVIVSFVVNYKSVVAMFRKNILLSISSCLGVIVLLSPLAWSIYKHPYIFKIIVGFQKSGWPSALTVMHNLVYVPINLFVYGKYSPETWLSNLPSLSIFCSVMFALGAYVYLSRKNKHKVNITLISVFIVGTIVISLNGMTTLSILIPFVYIVIAAGVGHMFGQWLRVFPRNPIAQGVGILAITLVVALTVFYQTRQYFVAWAQNNTTQQLFYIPEPVKTPTVSATISR